MYAGGERRAGARAPLLGPVTVSAAGRRIDVHPVDVSPTGIAVRTIHVPPRGTYMRVGFALRHAPDGPAQWLEADGVVARTEIGEEDCVVALEFQVIEGDVAASIQRYVHRTVGSVRRTGEYAPSSVYPPPSPMDFDRG